MHARSGDISRDALSSSMGGQPEMASTLQDVLRLFLLHARPLAAAGPGRAGGCVSFACAAAAAPPAPAPAVAAAPSLPAPAPPGAGPPGHRARPGGWGRLVIRQTGCILLYILIVALHMHAYGCLGKAITVMTSLNSTAVLCGSPCAGPSHQKLAHSLPWNVLGAVKYG